MASRPNSRKKKSKASQQNRERTVTTLTEDPDTQLLVPTPSEEPAPGVGMSSPFSIASSSGGGPNSGNGPNISFQIPGNYGYQGSYDNNNGYLGPLLGPNGQPISVPKVTMPPGKDDSEKLANLKAMIKAGQHDLYQAVDQPGTLLDHFQQGIVESVVRQNYGFDDQGGYNVGSTPSGVGPKVAPLSDASRRLPRIQTKDAGDPLIARKPVESSPKSGPQANTKVPSLHDDANLSLLIFSYCAEQRC